MQKFSQFYVLYRNTVQFEHNLWKLDCFEKSVLELMADPVTSIFFKSAHAHSRLALDTSSRATRNWTNLVNPLPKSGVVIGSCGPWRNVFTHDNSGGSK